jgi:hypothetical protein
VPPDTGARHRPADDVVEHEARGLLNVIVLLSYSLRAGAVTAAERRQWWAEIGAAAGRLAQLSAGPDAAHAGPAPHARAADTAPAPADPPARAA